MSLHAAARDGARADIERLLAGGASASAVNENGQTPLILACAHGHAACVELLLQHAAAASTLNHCDNIGRTALHHAAFKGRYECVEALLERVHAGKDADDVALDIDAQDETGQTALFKAAQSGHATVVLLLLTQAPRIFALDKSLRSAVDVAATADIRRVLLEWYCELMRVDRARPEPEKQFETPWLPDHISPVCLVCRAEFSLWVRRHHCRVCGLLVCWQCSPYMHVPRFGDDEVAVRCCPSCARALGARHTQATLDAQAAEAEAATTEASRATQCAEQSAPP